jgi:hypothetical protein
VNPTAHGKDDLTFSDISNSYTKILAKLSTQTNPIANVFSYQPWKEAWILTNRQSQTQFSAISLECPQVEAWKCGLINTDPATDLIISQGTAGSAFLLPSVFGNYEYYFNLSSAQSLRDPLIQTILRAPVNAQTKLAFGFMLPFVSVGTASSRLDTGTYSEKIFLYMFAFLHEGVHMFVQFKGALSLGFPWTSLNQITDRNQSDACFPRANDIVKREMTALENILTALKSEDVINIHASASEFLKARESRYQEIPSVQSLSDGKNISTDCRQLDAEWDRTEGIADYVAFRTLMNIDESSMQNINWYYQPFSKTHSRGYRIFIQRELFWLLFSMH